MRVSMTIYSVAQKARGRKPMTVEEFIRYAGTQDTDAVDLGYFWQDEEAEIAAVPGWLEAAGLELGGYIVGNNFVQPKPDDYEAAVNQVCHAIDCAARLDAKVLRVFAGGHKDVAYDDALELACQGLKLASEYAADCGIILALENHGRPFATVEDIERILDQVGSPALRLNFDIGNWVPAGVDPVEAARRLGSLVAMVHVKDCRRRPDGGWESSVVGEGEVDIQGALRELRRAGYDGFVSLEYEAKEDCEQGIPKSLAALRRAIQAIGG